MRRFGISIIFIFLATTLWGYVGCEEKEVLNEYEQQHVGKWELVDISYYGAHTYLENMEFITDSYTYTYPEEEESSSASKFNEMCGKYWGSTYITLLGEKQDGLMQGSLYVAGEEDFFSWSSQLGVSLKISNLELDSFGDGNIQQKKCEVALWYSEEQELVLTVDEKNVGRTLYSFKKVLE